ncbi:MAG: NAD(P)/FAD-dependent oxidoreductase [Chitinophagaceae bacterium]|nr:NAD(P)/FAD-dependent oxidoreductase [Chitinophagaceae bacterium]
MKKKRLVVIGGGAAGFFCAVNAARLDPELDVMLLEKGNKLLSKVKVSGGGRCNVTHACFSIAEMVKKYPRGGSFLKKAFHHFFTKDTVEWFAERGVKLKTEADGRMFPVTDNSETIIQCLLKEAAKYGVQILMNREVIRLNLLPLNSQTGKDHAKRFELVFSNGETLQADHVCIATGGSPKAGHYAWIREMMHPVAEPVPSLFTFNMPGNPITKLMGISVEQVEIRVSGTKLSETGPLLITHWGMSGPAVLKLSAWGARVLKEKNYHFIVQVNWVPDYNENTLRSAFQQWRFTLASQKMANRNPLSLPARLWEFLVHTAGIHPEMRWADLPALLQNKLIKALCSGEFPVTGKTTFKEEFVTAGGFMLDDIDHNTCQSKLIPGLYFAGEVMDVDGVTGGFNFQHAWTTGWLVAKAVSQIAL